MGSLAEQWHNEVKQGEQRGEQRGMQQGISQGQAMIIQNMLRKKFAETFIADATGVTLQEVVAIKKKFKL